MTAVTAVTESRDVKCKELQSRLGLGKMRNKKYRCPYCEQTSARMWNLRVHLRRRHEATKEQVGPSQAGPAYDPEPIYGFKSREKLSGRLSKNDFNYSYRSDVRGSKYQ